MFDTKAPFDSVPAFIVFVHRISVATRRSDIG